MLHIELWPWRKYTQIHNHGNASNVLIASISMQFSFLISPEYTFLSLHIDFGNIFIFHCCCCFFLLLNVFWIFIYFYLFSRFNGTWVVMVAIILERETSLTSGYSTAHPWVSHIQTHYTRLCQLTRFIGIL